MATGPGAAVRGHALIGLAALTLMWGLNWPLMKFSLRELTPLYFRAVTMTVFPRRSSIAFTVGASAERTSSARNTL